MKFFIYAPSYNENSGGCIALHKLVHIINTETEHEAFLVPITLEKISVTSFKDFSFSLRRYLRICINRFKYQVNSSFKSPVVKSIPKKDIFDSIVIYSEITFGNPLKARNIVRWFLHQPGHFTKEVCYGTGELYYKFNSAIKNFELYNSTLSNNELKVIHYPLEKYNLNEIPLKRNGTCYMVRKGNHKNKVHDGNAICLDGLSHSEISKIFKKCEYFISYDDYTAYSIFAVLCGCKSIVVPDKNISINDWYPNEKDRYGISYGFSKEQVNWAENTNHKVNETIRKEHGRSVSAVVVFVNEAIKHFNKVVK